MPQGDLSLSDYWRILRKRKWIVVASVVFLLGITGWYLGGVTATYRAVAKLKLETPQTSGNILQGFSAYYENPIETESRMIESRIIAEGVARRLDPQVALRSLAEFQAVVGDVQGSISAEPIADTNIIEIVVLYPEPERAAQIANFTAEEYIEANLREKNKQARQVREFMELQLTRTETNLRAAEDALKAMREQGTATGRGIVLQDRMADAYSQLASLSPKLTDAHPDIIRLKAQIEQLEVQLRTLPSAEVEFTRLNRDVEVNEQTYRTLRARLEEALIAEAEKISDASIIEQATVPSRPVGTRKRLSLAVGALLGILLGCVAAFLIETLDTSIGTIEDVETLLQIPVLAVIPHVGRQGEVTRAPPRMRLRMKRQQRDAAPREEEVALHAHYYPNSIAAEAYRILKTNLKLSADRKVILVTSAGPEEGKTTLLSNLGLVTAQSGARTVLVSSDLRRPELDKIFSVSKETGLSDVLQGSSPLERSIRGLSDFILGKFGFDETVKNPHLANLFLLTAGQHPDNPVELIGSRAMQELLASLKAQFDVILLDAPPLLPVADTLQLAPHVDGVVMVYQVGRISRAALQRAKGQLDGVGATLLGVVLNHVRPEVESQPSYYAYDKERSRRKDQGREGARTVPRTAS